MMKEYNMNKEAHRIYDNTPERKKARNERDRNRRKNDPEYKLKENLNHIVTIEDYSRWTITNRRALK